jgi:hypothetical protein
MAFLKTAVAIIKKVTLTLCYLDQSQKVKD